MCKNKIFKAVTAVVMSFAMVISSSMVANAASYVSSSASGSVGGITVTGTSQIANNGNKAVVETSAGGNTGVKCVIEGGSATYKTRNGAQYYHQNFTFVEHDGGVSQEKNIDTAYEYTYVTASHGAQKSVEEWNSGNVSSCTKIN